MFNIEKLVQEAVEKHLPKLIAELDKRKKREFITSKILSTKKEVTADDLKLYEAQYDTALRIATDHVK